MLTKAKARKILKDGSVRGHKLTDKQKRFFAAKGYNAGGSMQDAFAQEDAQTTNAIATGLSAIPVFGQILGPLVKTMGMAATMNSDNDVVSSSPGRYAVGGQVQTSATATAKRRIKSSPNPGLLAGAGMLTAAIAALSKLNQQPAKEPIQPPLQNAGQLEKDLSNMYFMYQDQLQPSQGAQQFEPTLNNLALNFEGDNINQTVQDVYSQQSPAGMVSKGGRVSYAAGGDIDLSSTAFRVKGNPSQVDSETYNIGQRQVKLDHDEVVKQGGDSAYVFSNRLKPTGIKDSFADIALGQENRIKRAEKKLTANPFDSISENTINRLNQNLANLAGAQEIKASMEGLRKPMADATTGAVPRYQSGGPIIPFEEMPFIDMGRETDSYGTSKHYFFDPYHNRVLVRDTRTGTYAVDTSNRASRKIPSKERIEQHVERYPARQLDNPVGNVSRPFTTTDRGGNTTAIASQDGVVPSKESPLLGSSYTGPMKWTRAEATENTATGKGKGKGKAKPQTTQNTTRPAIVPPGVGGSYNASAKYQGMTQMPDGSWVPDSIDGYQSTPYNSMATADQRAAAVESTPFLFNKEKFWQTPEGFAVGLGDDSTATSTPTGAPTTPFTVGDAMQTLSALSKFGLLIGGPEQQRAYTNATPISRETFDPTNALYQNQRSFTNAWNATSNVPSINTQRALMGSLYASNLAQQNNILSQYERQNQAANTQYEQRLANRRRENIQYGYTTDDINARNRGAYMNAVQNAFDTLSGLGQNFNQKSESNAALGMYKEMYKDVFDRFYNNMMQDKLNLIPAPKTQG